MNPGETPVLEMRGVRKTFPGVVALDDVDLTLHAGDVHMLLGENGAGKSTLMKILSGAYRKDEGEIRIDGRPVTIESPRDALAHERPPAEGAPTAAPTGVRLTRINKVFMLDEQYVPVPSPLAWQGTALIRAGGEPFEVALR